MEALELRVETEFEECLEFKWNMANGKEEALVDSTVEMVIDRSNGTGPCRPAKDAMVKRVPMGAERKGCVQNMPDSRHFLIAVAGKLRNGAQVRSPWVRAATLNPSTRENTGNLDPNSMPRKGCKLCPCLGYVPQKFELNAAEKMRCRRCGCGYSDHLLLEVTEILQSKEDKFRRKLKEKDKKEELTPLPVEAVDWDNRECALWFQSDGLFHPRSTVGLHRPPLPEAAKSRPGGAEGLAGKKGRVSVMTPTLESRQKFHRTLWACFVAQEWPDKELVVVETYVDQPSEFLAQTAAKDPRLVYVRYKRERGADWSIGVKRNMCAHLATGEFIANFDDDDLYAPEYLSSMAASLESQAIQAVKLSSWFIYEVATTKWGFCDPIAWGLANGKDESHDDVRHWAYGYGFSYVFRRRAGLDLMYQDINLGEDYHFINQLQLRRGAGCVALFHDDFGICLHLQHGGNTSNAIPLRGVDAEESAMLDVMELAPHLQGLEGPQTTAPGGGIFEDLPAPPSQRQREVKAYLPGSVAHVVCSVSATVAEFLERLRETAPEAAGPLQVFRVPPQGEAEESARDEAAVEVLGLTFLAEMDVAEHNIRPEGPCGKQWRQLLEQARRPMLARDRIGLRTKELWVRPPEEGEEEVDVEAGEGLEEYVTVDAFCQKSDKKSFFNVSGAFQVRIPKGGDVGQLRLVLGADLPPAAKIMAERPDRGLSTLREDEVCPEMVTLTDFKGKRKFYATFSRNQVIISFKMIRAFFLKPENQAKLDGIEEETKGDDMRYSIILCKLLADEVYPPILRRFDMPEDRSLQSFMGCMDRAALDLECVGLWHETELLMRNKPKISASYYAFAEQCRNNGLPEPARPW